MKTRLQDCGGVLIKHKRKMLQYEEKLAAKKRDDTHIPYELSPQDTKRLNSLPLFKKCDREFVGTAMKIMYKGNENELKNRVLKITKKNKAHEKKISPKKLEKVYSLMHERACQVSEPVEMMNRMQHKYMNSNISKALHFGRKNEK